MKEITQKWLIFVFLMCFILFVANIRNVKADVYLLGDSWLADTYNPNAVNEISYHTGEVVHPLAVNSMPSATLANDVDNYWIPEDSTVIIDIGLPDFFNGVSQADVLRNMITVVDYLASINAKILLSCPANGNSKADLLDKANRGVLLPSDGLCNKLKVRQPGHVRTVDLQSRLMAIKDFNYSVNDPVHLNSLGYTVFNIGIANAVNRMNGDCNVIDNQDLRNTIAGLKQTTPEQICTGLEIVENIWIR
jgi:hypothetical protein